MGKILAVLVALLAMTATAAARTLEDVRSSGVVTCGLDPARPGLSQRDAQFKWNGVFVDLCRAIAAAVFAVESRTNFVALAPGEGIVALQAGEIDVLMPSEPLQSGRNEADGLLWVIPFLHEGNPVLSSYAPVVRQGDDQWFQVVREVELQLIRAAQSGLTQAGAVRLLAAGGQAPSETSGLALSGNWRVRIIAAVGNHGEILSRNLGTGSAAGVNAVWSRGGLHWAPP